MEVDEGAELPKASLRIVLRLSESTNRVVSSLLYSPDQMILRHRSHWTIFFFLPVVTTPNGVKKNDVYKKFGNNKKFMNMQWLQINSRSNVSWAQ